MNEKYPVPNEILKIHDEWEAAEKARDSAVKGYFKFQLRNAIYFGTVAIEKQREFWEKLRELYPELGSKIAYDPNNYTVSTISAEVKNERTGSEENQKTDLW